MTENVLTRLKDTARMCMSEKRYAHTLGVYRECEYLADKCALSQKETDDLLAAALIHDMAKQLPIDKQKIYVCATAPIQAARRRRHCISFRARNMRASFSAPI